MAYARGKYALAISDRSGAIFPYSEMVKEWNGSFVHKSEFEAKHPQLEKGAHKVDSEALKNARPDSEALPTVNSGDIVVVGGFGMFDGNNTMTTSIKEPILSQLFVGEVTVSIT